MEQNSKIIDEKFLRDLSHYCQCKQCNVSWGYLQRNPFPEPENGCIKDVLNGNTNLDIDLIRKSMAYKQTINY